MENKHVDMYRRELNRERVDSDAVEEAAKGRIETIENER